MLSVEPIHCTNIEVFCELSQLVHVVVCMQKQIYLPSFSFVGRWVKSGISAYLMYLLCYNVHVQVLTPPVVTYSVGMHKVEAYMYILLCVCIGMLWNPRHIYLMIRKHLADFSTRWSSYPYFRLRVTTTSSWNIKKFLLEMFLMHV